MPLLGLISPPDPQQTSREVALIKAAKSAGVKRIVKLPALGADMPSPISAFARWQAPIEDALQQSSIQSVFLGIREDKNASEVVREEASLERETKIKLGPFVKGVPESKGRGQDRQEKAECEATVPRNASLPLGAIARLFAGVRPWRSRVRAFDRLSQIQTNE